MHRIAFVIGIALCLLSSATGVGSVDQEGIRPGLVEEAFDNLELENPALGTGTFHLEPPTGEWVKEAGGGCLIWADYKVRGKVEWSGPCRDGKAHGTGVLVAFDGDALEGTYEGELRDGKMHGTGVFVWGPATPWNGDRYEGEFRDNLRHGSGITIWGPESPWAGDRYEGEYRWGVRHGKATFTRANGDRFEGEFENDQMSRGVYRWADGARYEGEFKDWMPDGTGVLVSIDGTRYEGEFKAGRMHGEGTVTFGPNTLMAGDVYNGSFEGGKWHGQGTYTASDGYQIKAEFVHGEQKGNGTCRYKDEESRRCTESLRQFLDSSSLAIRRIGEIRHAAERGDGQAQYQLGEMYYFGRAVETDFETAFRWFGEAARQGEVRAQRMVGFMYLEGKGVEQDYRRAMEWTRRAAEQGDAVAWSNLGVMYDDGKGVQQDHEKAASYYGKAAERGVAVAQYALGNMYANGRGVDQSHEHAAEFYRQAAAQGDAKAQFALGEIYRTGKGVERNLDVAGEWYRQAAEGGYQPARERLGTVLVSRASELLRKEFEPGGYMRTLGGIFLIACAFGLVFWIILVSRQAAEDRRREESLREEPTDVSRFTFTGKAGEYFGIWTANVFLSIVTLGIYSAWAKVRRQRYFYGSTSLRGAAFDYLADPVAILKGRLIVAAVVGAFAIAQFFFPSVESFTGAVFLLILPWLIVRSRMFTARNSSFRNLRFVFRPDYGEAYRVFLGLPILAVLTLGLAYPYYVFRRNELLVTHSGYGNTSFSFSAPLRKFYGIYVRGLLLLVVIAGTVFAALAYASDLIPNVWLIAVAAVAVWVVVSAYVNTSVTNLVWSGTTTDRTRFESTLSPLRVMYLYLTNIAAIVLSVGLLIPWSQIRLARYRLDHLNLLATGDLDGYLASEHESVGATAEEFGDFYDIDIGI